MNERTQNWGKALLLWAVLLVSFAFPALAQTAAEMGEVVGYVSRVQNTASVERGGHVTALQVDTPLHLDDTVMTPADARLEITFVDGTTLTLGEKASITLDSYVYTPAQTGNQLAVSVVQGAFYFVSGQMGKLPDRDMSVRTAYATIGIRGTTFWGGPLDNPLDVLLLDGKVEVQSPGGAVVLDQPGKGTTVPVAGQSPTPPTSWAQDKRQRAIATITFKRQ